MELLILTFSAVLLFVGYMVFRLSWGLLALPFLIYTYIVLLYFGTLNFYFSAGHLSFVFVFVMALFYFAGFCLACLNSNAGQISFPTQSLRIYSPLNRAVLRVALITVFMIAASIAMYRLVEFGSTLFERGWYKPKAIESGTGVVNKLLLSTGVDSLIILSLIAYGLHKSANDGRYRKLAVLFFVSYMFFQVLNGGKSTAIMPFILFGMALFYCNRKIPRKWLIVTGVCVLVLALFIGAFWAASFSPWDIIPIFYERVTSIAALHLDYVLYGWAQNHSYELGNTVWLELKRFVAQVTTMPKEPLFNEFIGNLRSGHALNKVTGVSPELSLFGMAYANFGFPGAILSSVLFGFFVQRFNLYLLSRRHVSLFAFTLWVFFVFKLLGFVRSGNVFITLQSFLISIVPVFTFITFLYFCLALPFPAALKWRRLSRA